MVGRLLECVRVIYKLIIVILCMGNKFPEIKRSIAHIYYNIRENDLWFVKVICRQNFKCQSKF